MTIKILFTVKVIEYHIGRCFWHVMKNMIFVWNV